MDSGRKSITRAALGSSASLGDLYDARRDDFCGLSVFKKSIPAEALTLRDSHFSDISLVHSDDFSEKFCKLDVSAELSVSVLAGLSTLSGSGRFLTDKKKSARTVKSSLVYNIKTKEESVNMYHEALKDAFVIDAIQSGVATHVVTGITWGANSVVSYQFENKGNQDVREIGGHLSAQLNKMSLSISGGGATGDFQERGNSKGIKFEIKVFGDVLSKDDDLPTTIDGTLHFIKKLPRFVRENNGGRGNPLSYRLIPISLLANYLNFSIRADATFKTLEEASLIRVVQLFDQMTAAQQQFYDFFQEALEFKFCVKPKDLDEIAQLRNDMAIQETWMRSELGKVLTDVRSGKRDVSELEALLKKIQSSDVSPERVSSDSSTLAAWSQLTEKINFARALVQRGATYIGLGSSLDAEFLKDLDDSKSYIFYFTQRAKLENANMWSDNKKLFFDKMKRNDEACKFYAVDCDIHPHLMAKDCTSCVVIVEAGQMFSENILREQQAATHVPTAEPTRGTERLLSKPSKRVPLDIPCTGNKCNPKKTYEWACKNCSKIFDYGFDNHVYCNCGKTHVACLQFKCTDPKHGLAFKRHDDDFLNQLVAALRQPQDVNILILGEPGADKSVWINAFINYLTFESLEDAEQGDLCTLIPTNVVRTGADENQVLENGTAAKQRTNTYSVMIGNTSIRLIDALVVNDMQGLEQKNFQSTLNTLSKLDELHGIVILFKLSNKGLSNRTVQFCIKEQLAHLHRDASKNIMFCSTNSMGVGDTMPELENVLKEHRVKIPMSRDTVYCFDSEPYRFLSTLKNTQPVKYSSRDRVNSANSWKRSVEETTRMLEYIKDLAPHKIKSTLNLNHTRHLVQRLSRPLAEMIRCLQINRCFVDEEKKEIERMEESIKVQKGRKQMTTRTEIQVKRLDQPITVCSNRACVQVRTVDNAVSFTEYSTVCHDPCLLRSTGAEDSIRNPELLNCPVFSSGKCIRSNCGHSYKEHINMHCDFVLVTKQVENSTVAESLKKNVVSAAETKRQMIREKSKEMSEYEDEIKKIEQVSARFACSLKNNAMTPYSDAMEKYLNLLIREEKDKVATGGGNRAALDKLKKSRDSYIVQKAFLDAEMDKGLDDTAGPAEIGKLVHELHKLKYSGKILKDVLKCVEHDKLFRQ